VHEWAFCQPNILTLAQVLGPVNVCHSGLVLLGILHFCVLRFLKACLVHINTCIWDPQYLGVAVFDDLQLSSF